MAAPRSNKRLGGRTEDQIAEEIEQVRRDRREYSGSIAPLADDAHARVDALVSTAEMLLDGRLADGVSDAPNSPAMEELARLFVLASPAFAERAHRVIDESGKLSKTSRSEVDAKIAAFDRQEAELRLELEDRVLRARETELARRNSWESVRRSSGTRSGGWGPRRSGCR